MGFIVTRRGGIRDGDYGTHYVLVNRDLRKRGVPLDRVPRVRAEGNGEAWLRVWENEAEAKAFAESLKRETRDRGWHVEAVQARPSLGPLWPLLINVGRQRDGWVFAFDTFTKIMLKARFPESCRVRSAFVGSETEDQFLSDGTDLGKLTWQVLLILTGLEPEQLAPFESFQLIDPVAEKAMFPAWPISRFSVGSQASATSCRDTAEG